MAYTETIRIATGHYRIRKTSDEVKQLGEGKWQLLDPRGEDLGVFAEKRQAVAASHDRAGGRTSLMPPSQPRNIEELAAVLTAIRKPAAGHHYVVIEVADQLTR